MSGPAAPVLELREAAALIPYARNYNAHPPGQIAKIKASMVEYGWTNPVLVDGHSVVAGHGRLLAAEELWAAGVQIRFPNGALLPNGRVPVLSCTGWTPAQRRAYVIADNRIAQDAEPDEELLRLELQDLGGEGYDLSLTGMDPDELDKLLGPVAELGGMPELPDGDKGDFKKVTFTLHEDQAEVVEEALLRAKSEHDLSALQFGNENVNGNALYVIAMAYLGRRAC